MGAYDIVFNGQDGRKIAQVTAPLGAVLSNGTGVIGGAPLTLTAGANAVAGITKIGTFVITLPTGYTGIAASNGATIFGSPVALVAGPNVIDVTVLGAGTITVTITEVTTAITIEVPGIRTIDAVIDASMTGGYLVSAADAVIAGNKVTLQPYYFGYLTDAAADDTAIVVPNTVDLSGEMITLTVIGH
jgi:hypothetical protein